MDTPKLTIDQLQAVQASHGFAEFDGDDNQRYVVMSAGMFREMMGVGSDEQYQASLKAIEEGLADVEAGRTRPFEEFFAELDRKYGIQN